MKVRDHIKHIATGDIQFTFVHWKHVQLVVWGRVFPNKFELRMLVWDQNSSEGFSYKHGPNCSACFHYENIYKFIVY